MGNVAEFFDMAGEVRDNWCVRMRCDRFIMLVNKKDNRYVNMYATEFENGCKSLDIIDTYLDRHEKCE